MLRGSPGARPARRRRLRRAPGPAGSGRAAWAVGSSTATRGGSAKRLVELLPVVLDGLRHAGGRLAAGQQELELVLEGGVHRRGGPVGVQEQAVVVRDEPERLAHLRQVRVTGGR